MNPNDEFEAKIKSTVDEMLDAVTEMFSDMDLKTDIVARFGDRYIEFFDRTTDELIDRIAEIREH